jgi:hypothetical protein
LAWVDAVVALLAVATRAQKEDSASAAAVSFDLHVGCLGHGIGLKCEGERKRAMIVVLRAERIAALTWLFYPNPRQARNGCSALDCLTGDTLTWKVHLSACHFLRKVKSTTGLRLRESNPPPSWWCAQRSVRLFLEVGRKNTPAVGRQP